MTSEPSPDPRRKRALMIGGAIAVAAIIWNADGIWGDDDGHVTISVDGREELREARDTIREEVREHVRASLRDDEDEEAAADEDDGADAEDGGDTVATSGDGRVVETESGPNQRSFRIEGDDGRGVTISVDTDTEN